jgi:hypothetical protein
MSDTLAEIQAWFASIITTPIRETDGSNIPTYPSNLIEEIRKKIAPSPQLKSEERIGIYQQQYWWRLLNIMQAHYPSLVRLFGHEDFNHRIAELYLIENPPNDWFLSRLGADLPQWLAKTYREKDAPLVLGLAKLDEAYESLRFKDKFAAIAPECLERKLFLQPFVLLFEFSVDLFGFRSKLLETEDFPELKKSSKRKYFVLFRYQEENLYEEISSALFKLLSCFQKGARLCDLVPLLEKCEDVAGIFQMMATKEWLYGQ